MPLLDKYSGEPVLGDFAAVGSVPASALAAYDAWAAELGISNSTAIATIDDGGLVLDLGFAPLKGGAETRVVFSSEGALCLYRAAIPNTTIASRGAVSGTGLQTIARFYGAANPPACLLSVKYPSVDGGCRDAKWATSAAGAILYTRWPHYGGSNNNVHAAIRIKPNGGGVSVVCHSESGAGAYFQVFGFVEGSTSYAAGEGAGMISVPLTSGTVYGFETPPPVSLSGTVKDSTGTPASRTVRAYLRSSGALIGQTDSDAGGGYGIETFASGEVQVVFCADDVAEGDVLNDIIHRVLL